MGKRLEKFTDYFDHFGVVVEKIAEKAGVGLTEDERNKLQY